MAKISWQLSGDYFEACSCTYVCPCVPSNMAAQPTKGYCDVALVFHVDRGRFGKVKLDGLNFIVVAHTPGVMANGNWSVGLIVTDKAKPEQQEALTQIASGQAGGPMAAVAPLIGKFLGVERKPIKFQKKGLSRSVSVPGVLDQAVEGTPSPSKKGEPLYIDNAFHPANSRLALAKASRSHLHAFGIDWDDTTGQNNGHFAPFRWKN